MNNPYRQKIAEHARMMRKWYRTNYPKDPVQFRNLIIRAILEREYGKSI